MTEEDMEGHDEGELGGAENKALVHRPSTVKPREQLVQKWM